MANPGHEGEVNVFVLATEEGQDTGARRHKWVVYLAGSAWVTFFIASFVFLLWDHFTYKDITPPIVVAFFRDFFAILLVACILLLCWKMSTLLNRQAWKWILGMLYVICAIYWGWCHFYYSSGLNRHEMPNVVNILKVVSMIYVFVASVCMTIYLVSHGDAVCCLFLLAQ